MCGIAGYASMVCPQATEPAVRAMVRALARRGPDSEGVEHWDCATLGHRRLAILDLSEAGSQPMLSDDRQVGVVFNGCIYNFRELRRELESRGNRFRSDCDTEVLLHGYREWGIDALVSRLRGMFAFAVWDNPRRVLTLARDRLGVKPLVFCTRQGEIAFASTITALRSADLGGGIDPQAVLEFLEFGYVTEARAIFEGIEKLAPAMIAEWRDGRLECRQYWSLPETGGSAPMVFDAAVEQTEQLILEAVKLRLISDVPLGALLSGGVDSTLVCWALRQLNANVKAFTVRAPGSDSDESAAAAETAHRLGISHEIVDMPDTDFSLDELTDAYSEPFSCQSALAMLWVSRSVKRLATVLLTGDGGDDVFFGYSFLRHAWMAQRIARRLPAVAAAVWNQAGFVIPDYGRLRSAKNFLGYATGGLGPFLRAHDGLPYYWSHGILGESLAGVELAQRQIPPSLESARRLLWEVFSDHRARHFVSEFMVKVDGGTMHYALEARAPFLDQKIWEFAAALPPQVRFHDGKLKAVLREIVRRRVGPDVAFREKQGFTVPVERWLAERWSGMLDRLRQGTALERDGWVCRGSLEEPLRDALRRRWIPVQLWRLLVLDHWLEKNRVRASEDLHSALSAPATAAGSGPAGPPLTT
ncbi:MAG: asparagine synthase (glutamine-hydrolyzing) [Bryobacteraceae bacterium]